MKPDLEGLRLLGEHLNDPTRGDEEVVDKQGRRWRARRNPEPGVRLILESLDTPGPPLTMYERLGERPAGYPADLPFMAGAAVAVAGMPSAPASRMVIWSQMDDADAFAKALQEQGEAEGWETTRPLSSMAGFPMSVGEARRGGARRLMSVMSAGDRSAVTLMQTNDDEP